MAPPLARFGAQHRFYQRFEGGLVLGMDPAELDPDQTPDCLNVDLDSETVSKRKGQVPTSTAVGVGRALAGYAYYPSSGTRKLLLVVGQNVYADVDNDANFEVGEIITSALSASLEHVDLFGYKDQVFIGSHLDGVFQWAGSGSASLLAPYTAPASAPTLALEQTVVEGFEDSAQWTIAAPAAKPGYAGNVSKQTAGLANTNDDEGNINEGSACLRVKVTGNAFGVTVTKTYGAGSEPDLSGADRVRLWMFCSRRNPVIQLAFSDDSGNVDFGTGVTVTVRQKNAWFPVDIPLTAIPAASRDAVQKLSIRYVDHGGISVGGGNPVILYFDNARPVGPLTPDTYDYYYTYRDSSTGRESNPSPVATVVVEHVPPTLGVNVSVTASAQAGIDQIRIYRWRRGGGIAEKRYVLQVANATATHLDTVSDGTLVLENRDPMPENQIAPPKAKTYALVGHRMIAGNIKDGSTQYPWRVYVSRFMRPQEFASLERPDDELAGGWFDLPEKDPIVRILDFDGVGLIFCERSIWTLSGSSFPTFRCIKRADKGLSAREAVAAVDRMVFFLSGDGVRVLRPSYDKEGFFTTYVVSEPMATLVDNIPAQYRYKCALGIDASNRVALSYVPAGGTEVSEGILFDIKVPGALDPLPNPKRRGWVRYDQWGFRGFFNLKRGGGDNGASDFFRYDNGQLIGLDPTTGRIWALNYSEGINAAAIDWYWVSRAEDVGRGNVQPWVYLTADFEPQAGYNVTLTAVLDRGRATIAKTKALSAVSGIDTLEARLAANAMSRYGQIKVSGSHNVQMRCRSLGYGVYQRER